MFLLWIRKRPGLRRGAGLCAATVGQVAADSEYQVIVGIKATAQGTDNDQLNPMLQKVEETTGQAPEQLVADSGYTRMTPFWKRPRARLIA